MPSSVDRGVLWLEIGLTAPEALEAVLEQLLVEHGLSGWVVEAAPEGSLSWVFYLPQESGWRERQEAVAGAVAELGAALQVRGEVADEDWAHAWKAFYHPKPVGRGLVICPSWERFDPRPDQKVITLDPGMAFGTGYHASTTGCLELLEEWLLASTSPPPARILDVGTGSGILSIAALKLGGSVAVAVDNDPVAVRVARENLEVNGLASRAEVLELEGVPEGTFGLVLANLVARLLVELAGPLARACAPGGRLVLGGIVEERRLEVVEALLQEGLEVESERLADAWVSLRLRRMA